MLLALIVTVFAAETKALNTMPAAGAAGRAMITSSPTAAPVTVIVKSAEAVVAIEPKFKDAEPDNTLVIVAPEPAMKPFVDTTGPENVVRAMIFPYIQVSLLVGISSAGAV
jgi:alpha/beta superfamily hydrolase